MACRREASEPSTDAGSTDESPLTSIGSSPTRRESVSRIGFADGEAVAHVPLDPRSIAFVAAQEQRQRPRQNSRKLCTIKLEHSLPLKDGKHGVREDECDFHTEEQRSAMAATIAEALLLHTTPSSARRGVQDNFQKVRPAPTLSTMPPQALSTTPLQHLPFSGAQRPNVAASCIQHRQQPQMVCGRPGLLATPGRPAASMAAAADVPPPRARNSQGVLLSSTPSARGSGPRHHVQPGANISPVGQDVRNLLRDLTFSQQQKHQQQHVTPIPELPPEEVYGRGVFGSVVPARASFEDVPVKLGVPQCNSEAWALDPRQPAKKRLPVW